MGSLHNDRPTPAAVLRPRETERGPLSYGQQRLLFLDRWLAGSPVYNLPVTYRFTGALNAARLIEAVGSVAARHDVLFTVFEESADGPRQRVAPSRTIDCPLIDLTALGEHGAKARARQLIEQDAIGPFDLSAGPMLRAQLIRVAEHEHWLQLTFHHIACDGWSIGIFQRQLVEAYRAGHAPGQPPAVQYADYALWQHEAMQSASAARTLQAWTRALQGAPAVLDLGADRPRPPEVGYRGRTARFTLDAVPLRELEKFAADEGVTLYVVLAAAFQALVSRRSGGRDIVLGSPTAGRGPAALDELVGFFADLLVIRTSLEGDPTFRELVARTRAGVLDALSRSKVPFDVAVNHLHPRRELSYSPVVQVVFVLNEEESVEVLDDGIRIERSGVDTETAKYDLTWSVYRGADGLRLEVEYATDLFDAASVDAFAGHWQSLLGHVAADPDLPLSRAELMPAAEAEQIRQWSAARKQLPASPVHELVARSAAHRPDAVAVSCAGQTLTYAQLEQRATALAHRLRALGAGPEKPVGICIERSVETVVACLAILKAGGVYVPLDTAFPAERISFMLQDVGAQLVLVHRQTAAAIPAGPWHVIDLDDAPAGAAPEPGPPDAGALPQVDPDNACYVIFTSGSTGRPKGTTVTHRNVVRLIEGVREELPLGPDDVWTLFHSFAFDVSVFEMWGALTTGGRLVVVPYALSRDAEAVHALVREERVTIFSQTPSAFRQFEAADERAGGALALRAVLFAGEALHRPSVRRWASRHGYDAPVLANLYGITETTVHTTYAAQTEDDLGRELSQIGRPLPDLSVHVLDAHGRPCPIGVAGEIHVGGAGLARGYTGRPALTADRFTPDHLTGAAGARLYRSGDLGRWNARGGLEYLGRADFQVKIRGYRIETGEIESVLEAHPQVRAAAVIARTGDDGQADLAGYFVPEDQAQAPSLDELRAYLRTRLPDYMVPRHLVTLAALPLTAQGKVDRRALPEPEAVRPELAQQYVAPLGPVEQELAGIWCRVLGVDRVGRHDNFFDLGGDSIRSIHVLGQARTAGLCFTLQDLFRSPTPAGLAALATTADPQDGVQDGAAAREPFALIREEDRALLPDGLEDAYPMAELQVGMIYEMELNPERRAYLNVDGLRIIGPFDEARFRDATARVVARHPIMRTGFDLSGYSVPMQLVYPAAEMPLTVADLRGLDEPEQDRILGEYIRDERRRPFDHARPLLLRFAIHRLTDASFQWTVTEHHAVFDGWSLHSTLSEIAGVYMRLLAGEDPVLTPPESTYRDFIAAERATLVSEEGKRFWLERLEGRTDRRLPRWTGRPAPLTGQDLPQQWRKHQPDQGYGFLETLLPHELCHDLIDLARACEAPVKSVMLAAQLKVVSLVTGSPDVLIGVTAHGRLEQPGGTDVRGLFLNTLPFRLELPDGSWRELIRAVFATESELLPHRRYPLSAVQRELGGGALFEVNFVYNHFHVMDEAFGPGLLRIEDGKIDSFSTDRSEPTNFPLNVGVIRSPYSEQLLFGMDYHTDVLTPEQVLLYRDYYIRVLEQMTQTPDAAHHHAPLLGEAEQELLASWSAERPVPAMPGTSVHALVSAAAANHPDAPAVGYGREFLTYRELEERATALARRLRHLGVGPEVCVGVCLERSWEAVVACLAVLKAGGVYVPLDTAFPAERMEFMLRDVHAPLVVVHEPTADAVPQGPWTLLDARAPGESGEVELPEADPDNGCYVIFTSGSTGRPKGTMVTHRNVVRLVSAVREHLPLGPDDVWTLFHSFAFDASVFEMWGALATGGRLIVVPYALSRDAEAVHALVREEGVTIFSQTPSAFRQFEAADEQAGGALALRAVLFGGEALHRPSVRRFASRHGYDAPLLVNLYGITETTVHVTWLALAAVDVEGEVSPIGRPLPDLGVQVLDSHGMPCPVGVMGELHVSGAGLTRGYLGRPGLTAQRFIPDHLSGAPGARLYRSGDLGRWNTAGDLEYLGRADNQVKIRGYRIETGEIETVLLAHDRIKQAAVVPHQGTDGRLDLAAYLVPDPAAPQAPPAEELRAWIGARLPDYMIPRHFVTLDALPLTVQGKLDRRALPEPEAVRPDLAQEYVAPQGETEELLAGIWRQVLGVDRVGRHDNFFVLGGDSIRSIQILGRARDAGLAFTLQDINQRPTLETLAEAATPRPAPEPAGPRTSPFALLSEQDRALLEAARPAGGAASGPASGAARSLASGAENASVTGPANASANGAGR